MIRCMESVRVLLKTRYNGSSVTDPALSEANLAVPLIIAFQSTSFTEERSAFSSAFHNRAFLKGISGKRKT